MLDGVETYDIESLAVIVNGTDCDGRTMMSFMDYYGSYLDDISDFSFVVYYVEDEDNFIEN